MRKQLGLLMLLAASYHAISYCLDYIKGEAEDVDFPMPRFDDESFDFSESIPVTTWDQNREFQEAVYLVRKNVSPFFWSVSLCDEQC